MSRSLQVQVGRTSESASHLRPYPAYQDSGVPWLGQIPAHWEVQRNKLFLREVNNRSESGSEELLTVSQYTGVTRRRDKISDENALLTNAASLVGYKRVQPDDLVMNIMLAWNGSLGISPIEGIVSPAYCVFRAIKEIEPKFFHYLLRTPLFTGIFKTVSTGIVDSRLRLYPDVFSRLPSLFPPPDEQRAIARFLDAYDRLTRRYIRAQQRLVALLTEQKQALIQQTVTRGLDPDVRLKPSGIKWLGDIPEHWEVKRLKHLGEAIIGLTYAPPDVVSKDEGVLVLRASNVFNGRIVLEDCVFVKREIPERLIVREGDILICSRSGSRALIGKNARINKEIAGVTFGTFMTVFRSQYDDYLFWVFNSKLFEHQSGAFLTSTINQLTISNFYTFKVPIPSFEEQIAIARNLEEVASNLDTAITHTQRQIELVREYRTRLIADVVTGKLDVRGVQEGRTF